MVYATPSVRLFDWYVVTDLDDNYTNAVLHLAIDVKKYTTTLSEKYRIKANLLDANRKLVKEMISDPFVMNRERRKQVIFSEQITQPKKWTSETPNLYTLEMKLQTAGGKLLILFGQK